MAVQTITTLSNLLKYVFSDGYLEAEIIKASPAYGLMPKDPTFEGKAELVGFQFGNVQSVGSTYATVEANAGEPDYAQWNITTGKLYGIVRFELDLMMAAAKKGKGSFKDFVSQNSESVMQMLMEYVGRQIHGDHGNRIGQISAGSTVASPTITLANPRDIVNFHKGMFLQTSTDDGTSGSVDTGSVKVAAVNRLTGAVTIEDTGSGPNWDDYIAAIAASDYIFRAGDFGTGLKGFESYNPETADTGTFQGVDRSVDTRLSGTRYDGSTQRIEEALVQGLYTVSTEGCNPDTVLMNSIDFGTLLLELGSRQRAVQIESYPKTATGINYRVSYGGVTVAGPKGPVVVLPDAFAPYGVMRAWTPSDWKLKSIGSYPHIERLDGVMLQKVAGADAAQMVVKGYGAIINKKPWNVARMKIR